MTFRRFALAVLLLASSAAFATDKTDLYYNPSESGWGMTLANQGDTIFVTIYVYGPDNLPTWLVGTANLVSTDSSGVSTYGGDLFRTQGPYYAFPTFNPANVVATKVGTYTYRATSVNGGQITYTVDNTTIVKTVQRQTLAINPNVNGSYSGSYFSTYSGCNNPADNGNADSFINMGISGVPGTAQLAILFSTNITCTATGPYAQAGRMGSIGGTWSCTNGAGGTTQIFEIESGANAISGRFNTSYTTNGCKEVGYFSAARFLQ